MARMSVISLLSNLKYNVISHKMTDELDIINIEVGSLSTIAQIFKLPQQMIDYLWECIEIAKKNPIYRNKRSGVLHSYSLDDPYNLVLQNIYDIVNDLDSNPNMFEFINTEVENIYRKINTRKKIEPHLDDLWVNFQRKGEFQPLHAHDGAFSFVIWMDIPYDPKDEAKFQHKAGNFSFVISNEVSRSVREHIINLSPEMNGYCCFFPSDLCHQVYPFFTSDKDRISISGNISYHSVVPNPHRVYQFPFHTSET